MASEPATAPVAIRACQIDLAGHPLADPLAVIALDDFRHEFVAGRAGEAVIAAAELEIGIADAAYKQPQQRVAFRARGAGHVAHGNRAVFQMNRQHTLIIEAPCPRNLPVLKSGAARGSPSPKSSTIARAAAGCWRRCMTGPRSPPTN